jgi:hypothetical protein
MKAVRGSDLFNYSLLQSLKKIRSAKSRFQSLTSRSSNRAELVSQIELCDVLLAEIRTISCNLEKRTVKRSATSRRSAATRRNRGNPYRTVPQRDAPGRSKQRK